MNVYYLWIRLKYQFYKLYWKFKKPSKPSGFYGWVEIGFSVLDNRAVGIGIIKEIEDHARTE
jgi:hypothetical protein